MTEDENPLETNVREILDSIPDSQLLSFESAFLVGMNLINGAPFSYDVAAKIPDLCRPQDVTTILSILPHVGKTAVQHQGPGQMEAQEAGNIIGAIDRILKKHPAFAEYMSDSASLTAERIRELILGYLGLVSDLQRSMYLLENSPQIFNSEVDHQLALAAIAARLEEDKENERSFMQFRTVLIRAKDSGRYS